MRVSLSRLDQHSISSLTHSVEHGVKLNNAPQTTAHRRPDLSTFFSTLDLVDTSGDRRPNNTNALPLPSDVGAAFLSLANGFATMLDGPADEAGAGSNPELASMVQWLRANAEDPPKEVSGCSDQFLAELERMPKKSLKSGDSCPICHTDFLDGILYLSWCDHKC